MLDNKELSFVGKKRFKTCLIDEYVFQIRNK